MSTYGSKPRKRDAWREFWAEVGYRIERGADIISTVGIIALCYIGAAVLIGFLILAICYAFGIVDATPTREACMP